MPLPRFFQQAQGLAKGDISFWMNFPRIKSVPIMKDYWRLLYTLTKDPLVKVSWDTPIPIGVIHKNLLQRWISNRTYGIPIDWYDWCANSGITIEIYEKILHKWGMSVSYTVPKIPLDPYPYRDIYWAKCEEPTHIGFDYYSGLCTLYNAQKVHMDRRLNFTPFESVHYHMLMYYNKDEMYKHPALIEAAWGKYTEAVLSELNNAYRKIAHNPKSRKFLELGTPDVDLRQFVQEKVTIQYDLMMEAEESKTDFASLIQDKLILEYPEQPQEDSKEESDEEEYAKPELTGDAYVEFLRKQMIEEFDNPFDPEQGEEDEEEQRDDPPERQFEDNG
jgi:hypothetical protein